MCLVFFEKFFEECDKKKRTARPAEHTVRVLDQRSEYKSRWLLASNFL